MPGTVPMPWPVAFSSAAINAEMGDVRGRTVHRLEHGGCRAVGVDIGGGGKTEAALNGRTKISQDIAEEV